MIIDDIAKSSDWYFDENTNEWVNMTEYFSKARNKTRTKSIRYVIVPCSICGAPFLQKRKRKNITEHIAQILAGKRL